MQLLHPSLFLPCLPLSSPSLLEPHIFLLIVLPFKQSSCCKGPDMTHSSFFGINEKKKRKRKNFPVFERRKKKWSFFSPETFFDFNGIIHKGWSFTGKSEAEKKKRPFSVNLFLTIWCLSAPFYIPVPPGKHFRSILLSLMHIDVTFFWCLTCWISLLVEKAEEKEHFTNHTFSSSFSPDVLPLSPICPTLC